MRHPVPEGASGFLINGRNATRPAKALLAENGEQTTFAHNCAGFAFPIDGGHLAIWVGQVKQGVPFQLCSNFLGRAETLSCSVRLSTRQKRWTFAGSVPARSPSPFTPVGAGVFLFGFLAGSPGNGEVGGGSGG